MSSTKTRVSPFTLTLTPTVCVLVLVGLSGWFAPSSVYAQTISTRLQGSGSADTEDLETSWLSALATSVESGDGTSSALSTADSCECSLHDKATYDGCAGKTTKKQCEKAHCSRLTHTSGSSANQDDPWASEPRLDKFGDPIEVIALADGWVVERGTCAYGPSKSCKCPSSVQPPAGHTASCGSAVSCGTLKCMIKNTASGSTYSSGQDCQDPP